MNRQLKNEQIKKTRKETIARHKQMACKTYELKVDRSHLSEGTLEILRRLFLEAKWFYNHLIAQGDIWDADYKVTRVLVKNKNKLFESRELKHLSSQMRQEMIDRAKDNIHSLSKLKKNGHKVGALKFKSRIGSIPLRQYDSTYDIVGDRVRIQNIKQPVRVRGLGQIPSGGGRTEPATATLQQRHGDYFIHITTYQPKDAKEFQEKAVGIDFGIDKQLTLSNGIDIEESVTPTRRTRRIHRELSRRTLYGKNWKKTNQKLNKQYGKIGSQKTDIKNKVVSRLTSTYEEIHVQDDNIAGWQTMWGRKVQASAIGGIMSALKKRAHTLVVVPRYVATTRTCCRCGARNEDVGGLKGLKEKVYRCASCGPIDRNFNSAINIRNDGKVPMGHRESTPVETKTSTVMMEYLNAIPGVSASPVVETGSRGLAREAPELIRGSW